MVVVYFDWELKLYLDISVVVMIDCLWVIIDVIYYLRWWYFLKWWINFD